MKPLLWIALSAAMLLGCRGGGHHGQPESLTKVFMMKIEISTFDPPASVTVRNASEISRIQEWLKEVLPDQLPPEQVGNVIPWCTITVFEDAAGNQAPRTVLIYSKRDRATGFELLTSQQRAALLDIIHLKEPRSR
jgi:hypothetical protein